MEALPAVLKKPAAQVGQQRSILHPHFVGLMRKLGFTAATVAGAGLAGLGYAHWESKHPVLRRYTIEVAPRPGFNGLRVLHVSDLHMYPGQDFIAKFIAEVERNEDFDLVVSTGDNLGDKDGIDPLLAAYRPLLAYPGAFVLGSNDYYSPQTKGLLKYLEPDRHINATRHHRENQPDLPWLRLVDSFIAAGWLDMSNRRDNLSVPTPGGEQILSLAGVDDPHIQRDRFPADAELNSVETSPAEPAVTQEARPLRLGLTHAPYLRVLDEFCTDETDVVFAGHTHGGQVRIPGYGSVVTNCDLPRGASRGISQWNSPGSDHVTQLEVSAGLGTSPFAPIRFACQPEASLVHIVPAQS